MSEVVEIDRIEDLAQHRLVWTLLHRRTRGASIFQSLEWLELYWRHYGGGQQLRVLLVESGGELVGIVPLVLRQERTRVGNVRVLTWPLDAWGSFFGPIGPNLAATMMAAMRYLADRPRDWDMLDLRWIDRQCDRGRTPNAMQLAGLHAAEADWEQVPLIDTRVDWESYLASRPKRLIGELRRNRRRLAELGELTHVHYRPQGAAWGDGDPRWDLYDACVALAEQSWQGSSQSGTTLSHAPVRAFLRESHALAARLGMLDLHLLTLSGRPVAFAYNYHCDGRVIGLRCGYLPELARYGLGNLMFFEQFRASFAGADHTFDLGPNWIDVKAPWMTRLAASARYTHYRSTAPKAQLLRLKHWAVSRWRRAASGPARTAV